MEDILVNKREMTGRDWAVDALIAFAATVFAVLQMYVASSPILFTDATFRYMTGVITRDPGAIAYFMVMCTTLPLVVRRRIPWLVLAFTLLIFVNTQGMAPSYSFSPIGPALALFTVANERPRKEIIVAVAATLGLLVLMPPPGENDSIRLVVVIQNVSYMLVGTAAGLALHAYRASVKATEERAAEAERRQEEVAARRVEEERVRIAREIHDITAHSLSAVSIQAAAAERLIDRDSEKAKEAIAEVRKTSKSALEEIRSMIGVLRNEGQQPETQPTNGTDRIADLCAYAKEAGLQVSYDDARYDRRAVPAFVDVALFGIAREAVTNTVRHAQARNLRIVLESSTGQASLVVEDDGTGAPEGERANGDGLSASRGHGIEGMAERAHVLHGTFQAGNRTGGGFHVAVVLPFGERDHREIASGA